VSALNRTRGPACVDVVSSGLTTATTAYTSGDQLGAEMTVTLASNSEPCSGYIVGALVTDDSDVMGAVDLVFFTAASSPAADNAAAAWADANAQTITAAMSLTTVIDTGANRVVTTGLADVKVPFVAPTGRLFLNAITRTGNAVFASGATALRYRIFVEMN
jgi:hypothetical protein